MKTTIMKDFKFINHGVNHVSDFGAYPHHHKGYRHCQHGVGFTLFDAIENALLYISEDESHLDELREAFLNKHGPIKDTEEVECQTDSFYYVTFFYN